MRKLLAYYLADHRVFMDITRVTPTWNQRVEDWLGEVNPDPSDSTQLFFVLRDRSIHELDGFGFVTAFQRFAELRNLAFTAKFFTQTPGRDPFDLNAQSLSFNRPRCGSLDAVLVTREVFDGWTNIGLHTGEALFRQFLGLTFPGGAPRGSLHDMLTARTVHTQPDPAFNTVRVLTSQATNDYPVGS